jgi:hypothetical protein
MCGIICLFGSNGIFFMQDELDEEKSAKEEEVINTREFQIKKNRVVKKLE